MKRTAVIVLLATMVLTGLETSTALAYDVEILGVRKTLPIFMENVPQGNCYYQKNRDHTWLWNQYMPIYVSAEGDGFWKRGNDDDEFAGFPTDDLLYQGAGIHWGDDIGVTPMRTEGVHPPKDIIEADIAFNGHKSWTCDRDFAEDNPGTVNFYDPVLLHEMGHSWGLEIEGDLEDYMYGEPTVMHNGNSSTIEDSMQIHVPDAHLLRRLYNMHSGFEMPIPGLINLSVTSKFADASHLDWANAIPDKKTGEGSYMVGESITVSGLTVENTGTADLYGVHVRLYLSTDRYIDTGDTLIQDWEWDSFASESYQVIDVMGTIPPDLPGGTYYVGAIITHNGSAYTPDDFYWDNATRLWNTITVRPNVDLIVESIETNPVSPLEKQTVNVTVTVRNQGVDNAPNGFLVKFYKDRATEPGMGVDMGDILCQTVGLGANNTYPCTGTVQYDHSGTYKMWAVVDPYPDYTFGQVEETNESNNALGQSITVLDRPDLVVYDIAVNPASPMIGQDVDVVVWVRNEGHGIAGPFSIDFYRNREDRPSPGTSGDFSCPKDGLISGATAYCVVRVSYQSAGTYKMWAQVDTRGQVLESRESNNVRGPQSIAVSAKGVLSVQPGETFISSGRQGGPFTPSSKKYTLKNIGGSDIDYEVSRSGDWTVLQGYRGTLAPQASADVIVYIASGPFGTAANNLPPGTYTDTINFVNTTNGEGSTFRSVILTVLEPLIRPDLVETGVSDPPAAARPGSSFNVYDTTKNQGAYDAAESGTSYYLSPRTTIGQGGEVQIGSHQVPALIAGATSTGAATVLIPRATKLGTYYLLACANTVSPILAETNRNNNCIASSTTVQLTLPDYVETSVSEPPPSAPLGTKFAVTDTVTNQGAVAAPDWTSFTRYYLVSSLLGRMAKHLLQGSRTVESLGLGGTSTATANVYVPTKVPLGVYHLMACADDTNVIPETVDTNNCRTSTGTIQITK